MSPICPSYQLTAAFLGGVAFLAAAICAKFFFESLIDRQLRLHLPLSANASSTAAEITSYKLWKDIPFPVKHKFYLFHVENPLEVLQYGERPVLTQKGPFIYDQRRHKVDVRFSADRSTVSYRELSFFHFDAEGTNSRRLPIALASKLSKVHPISNLSNTAPHVANRSAPHSLDNPLASLKNPSATHFPKVKANGLAKNTPPTNLPAKNLSTAKMKSLSTDHPDAKPSAKVRVLNVPLLAIMNRAKYLSMPKRAVLDLLISHTGSSLFVERTVEELLWGYEDPLLVKLKYLVPDIIPLTKFGWFMNQNGSDMGRFKVFTGHEGDLSNYLSIVSWKGQRRLNLWPPKSESPCNSFDGATDGSAFGPGVKSTDKLRTFDPRMCRGAFNSSFVRSERRRGVDMLRFEMDNQTFRNASVDPANACFCSGFSSSSFPSYSTSSRSSESSVSCPPSGVLNISDCSFGAPVFLSQPHFLNGDPALARRFKGISPSATKHGSSFYIEPTTGINTEAKVRLQLNGYIQKHPYFSQVFQEIGDDLVFPVSWLEEAATMDDRTFNDVIKRRVVDQIRLCTAAEALLIALTTFCFLSVALLTVHRWRSKREASFAKERLILIETSSDQLDDQSMVIGCVSQE